MKLILIHELINKLVNLIIFLTREKRGSITFDKYCPYELFYELKCEIKKTVQSYTNINIDHIELSSIEYYDILNILEDWIMNFNKLSDFDKDKLCLEVLNYKN